MASDKDILVCAAATAEYCLPNSSFDRKCESCGCRVMISPSGQRRLANSDLTIRCTNCFAKEAVPEEIDGIYTTAESYEELERELSSPIANPWRHRN